MAYPLLIESYGRGYRRFPLGSIGGGNNIVLTRFHTVCFPGFVPFYFRALVFPKNGTSLCGCGLVMSNVIQVENLGKSFLISHQKKESFPTFRDTLVGKTKKVFSAFAHPFKGSTGFGTPSSIEEFWALRGLSFEVKAGDRIGVIGKNGAGKSTLLKILSRITQPTEGRLALKGRVATLLEVGTGFHPELTGRENIFLNGAILGMARSDIQRRFDQIVDFSGVEKFLDTPVKRYSSGMRVRLGFSVAAHLEPDILIVDEVLAVGDRDFQQKCIGCLDQVGKDGKTIIFVSHNMSLVKRLCEKSILLENGSIREAGITEKIVERYVGRISNDSGKEVDEYVKNENMDILDVKILNMNREKTDVLYYREPFIVSFLLRSKKIIKNLSFHIGIDSIDGTRVFTSSSLEFWQPLNLNLGDNVQIFVCFKKINLMPGSYILSKLYGRQGNSDVFQLMDIMKFCVEGVGYKSVAPPSVGTGLIAGVSNWSLEEKLDSTL